MPETWSIMDTVGQPENSSGNNGYKRYKYCDVNPDTASFEIFLPVCPI
jgi:hypothetical protein